MRVQGYVAKVSGMLLLALILIVQVTVAHSATPDISRYSRFAILWLLTADDPARIRLGAQWLEHLDQPNIELADVAAKTLWESQQYSRKLDDDTVAWLARALGSSHSKRYQPLLEDLANAHPGKIERHASNSLAQLSASEARFDPAVVDREQVKNSLIQEQRSAPVNEASFFDLQVGTWIEEIFEKYGYPSDINAVLRSRRAPFVGRIYVENLLLIYGSKGVVELDHDRGDWYATIVTPRLATRRSDLSVDDVIAGLQSSNVAVLRSTARNAFRMGVSDEPTLDAAAGRLRSDMHTSDNNVADALAYLCSIIGNSGNPRYRDLIAEVAGSAKESKIRKYAAAALKKIPQTNVEQYTGLDASAAK